MEYILLLIGFAILLGSGHFLVVGSVELAKRMGISTLVIGVTVVSLGTSAPELFVSLKAALSNHPEIAVGNVIGSNISNIALVLAFTALVNPIPVKRKSIVIDWPIMMFSGILFYLFIVNQRLERYEGIIFFSSLVIYVFWSIRRSHREELNNLTKIVEFKTPLWQSIVYVLVAAVGLYYGSSWLIDGATEIAMNFGVSERVISITLIAFGTSVPELATSLIAAFKKETDISVGNIIGSNTFNTFGILGTTAIVTEIPVSSSEFGKDILWMLAISALLFVLILPVKGGNLNRYKGMLLISVYAFYIYLLFQ